MTLTIYSNDYDTDCCNGGLSGCVFVEGDGGGGTFANVQEALKYVLGVGLELDTLQYCYRTGGEQLFFKMPFSINGSAVGSNPMGQGSSPCGATSLKKGDDE